MYNILTGLLIWGQWKNKSIYNRELNDIELKKIYKIKQREDCAWIIR